MSDQTEQGEHMGKPKREARQEVIKNSAAIQIDNITLLQRRTWNALLLIVPNWQTSPKILKLLEMRHENAASSSLSNRDSDSGCA
jgi:hypothetical protein